jgi:hypothetical protein
MSSADPEMRRGELLEIIANFGLEERPHPVTLASGGQSKFLVDAKRALAHSGHLKGRGLNKLIEGAAIGSDTRVLLIDDVVTMGGSIRRAYDAVIRDGASVVFATTLVDRGTNARKFFESVNVAYRPLLTYLDLHIPPVDTN